MSQQYKAVVSLNLPIGLLGKIDELMERHRTKNRSDVIRQLLEVGIFVESKMGLVETWTSEDMDAIKSQMKSGQLVDWIHTLELKQFNTLAHIFEEERKARGLKK